MDNKDIGIKSLFLGPKSENADWVREEISQIFSDWFTWRTSLYGDDGAIISDEDKNDPRFWQVRERIRNYLNMQSGLFRAEIPTYPPPATSLTWIIRKSPFPHSLVMSPRCFTTAIGRPIEEKAISCLLNDMIGYSKEDGRGISHRAGTLANFEAIWHSRYRTDHWLAMGATSMRRRGTPYP